LERSEGGLSPHSAAGPRLRLVEPLIALSVSTDLARGQPPEQALRACVAATKLADRLGLGPGQRSDVYFTTLLRFAGCTATSHEYARHMGGDDIDVRRRGDMTDTADQRQILGFLLSLGAGSGPWGRVNAVASALVRARSVVEEASRADCEVASRTALRLGLGRGVAESLLYVFERWDGKGLPRRVASDDIPLPARVSAVAFAAVMFYQAAGPAAALQALRRWSGRLLDPHIAAAMSENLDDLAPDEGRPIEADVLAREPAPQKWIGEPELDGVCRVFGDFADLKSPYFLGHSQRVAELAAAAAGKMGLSEHEITSLRRGGLLHDLGRSAVSTGIWEKATALSNSERDQARLHPYYSERILRRSSCLAPLAELAGSHHERLDGSGYYRGVKAASLNVSDRVLAAADACAELLEDRPGRAALHADAAAAALRREALDPDALRAVLDAAGAAAPGPIGYPAGLSDREVQVLRLLARGRSMKEIAAALVISQATVHTHVAHIYEKAGISTRAAAALFALENGLLR